MPSFEDVRVVAVLDDVDDDREMTTMAVQAAGFTVIEMPGQLDIDGAISWLRANAHALVTDHNLRWGDAAPFSGAELARRCNEIGFPAVLVTGYTVDTFTSIREHRRGVPELVLRGELDGDRVASALAVVYGEVTDRPSVTREPRPAIVRVDRVNAEAGQIDVVVSQWNPHLKVSMPMSLLGTENVPDDPADLVDRRYFAIVNTGAESEEDLYFEKFQEAPPEPDESDLQ